MASEERRERHEAALLELDVKITMRSAAIFSFLLQAGASVEVIAETMKRPVEDVRVWMEGMA